MPDIMAGTVVENAQVNQISEEGSLNVVLQNSLSEFYCVNLRASAKQRHPDDSTCYVQGMGHCEMPSYTYISCAMSKAD